MIASASIQRRTKNVGIISVVILELKLRDVQRQVFAADSAERQRRQPMDVTGNALAKRAGK
jgi:hypothetical protein